MLNSHESFYRTWINHHNHPWFSAQLDLFGQCIACHNEWQAVAGHSPPIPLKVGLPRAEKINGWLVVEPYPSDKY